MLADNNKGEIPYGYKEVKYIQCSGQSYIDTGYNGQTLLKVTFTMTRLEDTTSSQKCVFGYWSDTTSVQGVIQLLTQNNKIVAPTGRNAFTLSGISSSTTLELNTPYTFSITQTRTSTIALNAYLFARNLQRTGAQLFNPCVGLGRVTILRGDILVREYVPCISPTGVAGMYDKVSKTFFGSANSDYPFIAGSLI
jgi:hypothetical protein